MKLEKFKQKDNKKIGIIIFTVCCILLITGVYLYSSFAIYEQDQNFNVINGTVEDPGDLYFAFYVDDVISKTMPTKGSGYTLDTEKSSCTNGATPTLNEDTWSIKVNNLTTTHTKCTLYFKYIPSAVDTILALGESDELAYDGTIDNNLRYIGANPNNYVLFNNELWRIIGVMNNIDDGTGKKEARLKIIRNESFGNAINGYQSDNYIWSKTNNYWGQAELMTLLNDGGYWNRTSSACYFGYYVSNGIYSSYEKTCDFSENGLTTEAKEMVASAVWNLGASEYANAATLYTNERENSTIVEGVENVWTGKVGLFYPSDFAFATGGGDSISRSDCLTMTLNTAYDGNCLKNNWLHKGLSEYTITPPIYQYGSSSYLEVFCIAYGNVFQTCYVSSGGASGHNFSPVVYLSSNVKITSGTGSESDPYVLSL